MPEKKKKQKVIPHCYRRTLSKTLSNSSVSQLVRIGSYKKRINNLSRNNRHLATALQEARVEAAVHLNIIKDCAKDCNKILFARLKLNEMAKNFAKFVTDLEEVRSYLNIDFKTENPFTYRKGSPSDKLGKEPAISFIEEVTESSVNEVVTSENVSTAANLIPDKSDGIKSDVGLSNQGNNADIENMEIAPILFADDSEEKKKKSSCKSKASKKLSDPDKDSLTPELNDLTSLKLKRNSSRRQTQVFQFPASRSTSRGKATSVGKENSPKELVTPEKPPTPTFAQQKQTQEEIYKSTTNNNTEGKETENPNSFPENHLESALYTNQCNVPTLNLTKKLKTVTAGNQPPESNLTVLLCEDMELTDVIRPVHEIIVQNGFPFTAKSVDAILGSDTDKDIKENGGVDVNDETKENNNIEIISEKDSQDLFSALLNTPKLLNDDDDVQLPEINEDDEVQNVGLITFCESNVNDKHIESRATMSNRKSRKAKPVKYAIFFSSDESDEDSPFKITTKATSKRKTASSTKPSKASEKTKNPVKTVSSAKPSKTSEKTEDPVKTVSSAKPSKTSEKTEDPVKTVSSAKPSKTSEKTEDPVKTVSSAKPSKTSEKTEDPVKTVSSAKPSKTSEKTEDPVKTVSSTKPSKTSEKTEDPVKTVSSTKPSKTSEKAEDSVKTVSSTKPSKTSEKAEDSVKTVSSTKPSKTSEKAEDSVKTLSSTKPSKTSEKTEDPVKTVSSTKTGKSTEKTERSIKTLTSTKVGKSKKTDYPITTVIPNKTGKSSEKTEDPINCHKVPLEKEIKSDHLTCPIDVLHSKKVEKKSSKKPKDIKSSSKDDLLKQSPQKHSVTSKDKKLKLNKSKNVKKLVSHQENIKSPIHENVRKLIFSPDLSSPSILKKTQPNFQTTKEIGVNTLLNKVICDDDLDNSLTNVLETPKSESKKVSFAPTDIVCNFRRMSVSKKIAENKKVRRTSKSAFDCNELSEKETQMTKTVGTNNSSETTNVQRSNNPVFNFSDDTELYTFEIPSNSSFSSVATTDDLLFKFSTTSNASQKNINKNDKHLKKVIPVPKPGKLSLKRSKDLKNAEPLLTWDEISERRNALLDESPVPVPKPPKRKSLFKGHSDDDAKENINSNDIIVKIPKNVLQEKDINMNSELSQNNHFKKSSTKRQSKVQRKVSTKKLSDKPKLPESAPEIKRKRQSVAVKGPEDSFVLKDTVNLPEVQDEAPLKRRSKPVSYREPTLNKKMRRE